MSGPHPDSRKVSELLAALSREHRGERVRIGDLLAAFGDRAFGVLMLVFALPNAVGLGAIPGVSTVFGLPQVILALQMTIGFERPWMPAWLLERGIARTDFASMVDKSMPYLVKAERILRPRWTMLASGPAERILGVAFLVPAIVVSLPIPLGNWLPAVAIGIMAIGLIERDGLAVSAGTAVGVVSVALAAGVVLGGAAAGFLLFQQVFG
ncbi:MAG: exopolysaccharide biosynthesis protein [Pseudomonadota bacterium]